MIGSGRLLRTRDLADIAFESSEAVHSSANVVARLQGTNASRCARENQVARR